VAYCDAIGPVVLPVNHVVIEGDIWFRVAPYSQLAVGLHDRPTSYEVDDFDPARKVGWSVLVRGVSEFVDVDDLPDVDQRPAPWVQGQRTLYVRLRTRSISGRRISPPPSDQD
jgi:uncharacterized protein